jgi:proline iminopeptidase
MKTKHLLHTTISILISFLILPIGACGTKPVPKNRETVLDRVIHIEKDLILEIPKVPRMCEVLKLKKSRVNVGDCELYVEEEGKGIPIVLLHGGPGATHHYFHPYFSQAKKFARVIYYDQRGCGISDYKSGKGYTVDQAVEDLEKLREGLGIGKWVVLGHSYGGYLAQRYVMKHPESISGLILMTALPGLPGKLAGTRQYDYISDQEKQRMREIRQEISKLSQEKKLTPDKSLELLVYNNHINGDWKRQSYYKPSADEFIYGALYEWKQDTDFNSVISQDANKMNLEGAFKHCPVPTLILESKWDLTWTADKPDIIHQNHPGSQMITFEQSAHSPFADEPERFFRELKTYVKNLPPVTDTAITQWREYLSQWQKDQEDKFLTGPMSEAEAKAIEEFRTIRKKILVGKKYMDTATPLHTFLSYLSALHFRDLEAMKNIHTETFDRNEKTLAEFETWIMPLDILRAPAPPEHPELGTIWPVYLKNVSTNKLDDVHLFIFWDGKWMRQGNMGGASDWRPWAPWMQSRFLESMKKK